MDITTFSSEVREVASTFSSLGLTVGTFTTAALFLWICRRAGSGHAILTRIWLKFAGKQSAQDPIIQRYLNDQENVHCFQFVTSVHPRTLQNVHAMIDWCDRNNISIRDVRACGDNFNLRSPGLHLSKRFYRIWGFITFLFAIMLFMAATFAGLATFTSSALMTAKTSGHLFLLSPEQARILSPSKTGRLHISDCKSDYSELAERTGFDIKEVSALCKSFTDDTTAKDIGDSVTDQRRLFGPCLMLLTVWVGWFGREARHASAAIRLAHQLASSDSPTIALREGRLLSWGQKKLNV